SPHGARVLLDQDGVAEGALRGVTRLVGRQTRLLLLLGLQLKMGAQLPVEVLLATSVRGPWAPRHFNPPQRATSPSQPRRPIASTWTPHGRAAFVPPASAG